MNECKIPLIILEKILLTLIQEKSSSTGLLLRGNYGNYLEKCPVRIWKRNIPLRIDLLISNNFSSMTFFCATRILRIIGRQSTVYNHS